MSVRMDVYLVDWDDFQEKVLLDDVSEVLEADEFEGVALDDPSARAPAAFLEAFDRFKRAWKSEGKLYFKEVFDTLFADWRGGADRIMELQDGEDGNLFGVDTALKAETARELLKSAGKIHLEECRALFEATFDRTGRFQTFEEWKTYGEAWLGLLARAAEQDKGLIVVLFG